MKTYLVTGGLGFIGTYLVQRLLATGHRVNILDDLSTGVPGPLLPRCRLTVGSVTDFALLKELLAECDGCFHLAAISSIEQCNRDVARSIAVNLGGSVNVLEACRESGKPVVLASSAAASAGPTSQSPVSNYGVQKLAMEMHAHVAAHLYGLACVVLRIHNVYGPRSRSNIAAPGVIGALINASLSESTFEIHGDGQQRRDFVHVADVADCFSRAIAAASSNVSMMEVCTGASTSISDVVELVQRLSNRRIRLVAGESRRGEVRDSVGDPRTASNLLGWKPRMNLADGLLRTLQSMQGEVSAMRTA